MTYPFAGSFRVTSPYGYRTDPITGESGAWHGGLDLVGQDYTVRAAMGGQVVVSQIITDPSNRTSEWGNYVCVLGEDGNYIYYCHLASRAVAAGQHVSAGDKLGIMGATGKATGDHLHFEVRNMQNQQLNAADYLGIPNEAGAVVTPSHAQQSTSSGDSEPQDWAQDAVTWAVQRGVIYGDEHGDLQLRQPCTREMALVFIHRAMGGGA